MVQQQRNHFDRFSLRLIHPRIVLVERLHRLKFVVTARIIGISDALALSRISASTQSIGASPGTSALKLEDPRLPMMMMSPLRRKDAGRELQPFVYLMNAGDPLKDAKAGTLLPLMRSMVIHPTLSELAAWSIESVDFSRPIDPREAESAKQ